MKRSRIEKCKISSSEKQKREEEIINLRKQTEQGLKKLLERRKLKETDYRFTVQDFRPFRPKNRFENQHYYPFKENIECTDYNSYQYSSIASLTTSNEKLSCSDLNQENDGCCPIDSSILEIDFETPSQIPEKKKDTKIKL